MAASTTPFRISTPLTSPPPRWATLERELLHTLGDACEEFFLKCEMLANDLMAPRATPHAPAPPACLTGCPAGCHPCVCV